MKKNDLTLTYKLQLIRYEAKNIDFNDLLEIGFKYQYFDFPCKWECCMLFSVISRDILHVQIIAEGANGPTTIEADKIFLERNVLVIPVS